MTTCDDCERAQATVQETVPAVGGGHMVINFCAECAERRGAA